MSALLRPEASARIVGLLEAWLPPAGVVAMYAALPDEPDLDPLLLRLAQEGRLALPRVDGDQLHLHLVRAPDDLGPGSFYIREPAETDPEITPDDVALIIVPGRAFDAHGGRLGRGGGHYDRLLARFDPSTPRIGVAFAEQLVDRVPTDDTDQPMHGVVTPMGAVRVTGVPAVAAPR